MLNLTQIERLAQTNGWERLVERVLENGRGGLLAVRMRLALEEAIGPAAIGLGLQRACELTYGPTPLLEGLAARLVHMQRQDGHFVSPDASPDSDGSSRRPSPAATAIAIRALLAWRDLLEAVALDASAAPLDRAIDRGLFALACAQREDGGFGRGACDLIESAIVLWQLGGRSEFRRAVRYHALLDVVEEDATSTTLVEVSRLAHAAAA